jgi:2-polyprenyl-3-methyl-5-hydroxy-6-metoxy-1,4-benzoquinol methylase
VPDETERLEQSWIANSSAWCTAVRENLIESRREVTNAAIVDAILRREPRRVLDVGCGEGWLARELASRGIDVTGVDASEPLIEAANAMGGARYVHASYRDIIGDPSLLAGSFDVIAANFSLLDDRAGDLLRALRNVLAAGGHVIVQTIHPLVADSPYSDGWRTETFNSLPGDWPAPMPWYFRTLSSWHQLFTHAGYLVPEIQEPRRPNHPSPSSILFVLSVP